MTTSISEKILRFIKTVPLTEFDDGIFARLAQNLFQYQFKSNAIYRGICQQQYFTSGEAADWRNIPAVTTSAFKEVPLTCFPVQEATAVFHTSGTTQKRAGKHYFRTLEFYRAAMLRSFAAHCLAGTENKMRMFFLGPTAEYFSHSSLGYMFSGLRNEFGDKESAVFFSPEGIDAQSLQRALDQASQENTPVFILGTALALLECMAAFQKQNRKFKLPFCSRILDTGGYKGRHIEVTREELRERLCETFGVPREYLLNEYGMTELSSQFYESQLPGDPRRHDQRAPSPPPSALCPSHLIPPWTRVVAADPENLKPVPEGEVGLLRIFDLANVDSVMAIQTEDLGRAWQDRLELIGRATGAELRGCSLLIEAIVDAA
jgi:acyl-CoA synthetase (AMP-forming)/AMP-acid ligase II